MVDALTFQAQVRQMETLLFRVSMSYLGNAEDAADAVQDALTKAWEKQHLLKRTEQFCPWVMRILTNRCKDILRRRKRRSFFPLEEDTLTAEMPLPQSPVMEAVSLLKPELRTVVLLRYMDGYSVLEIAHSLGLPEGTVKTRLHTARKCLKHTLLVEWEEDR